jgi:hypothetical protein
MIIPVNQKFIIPSGKISFDVTSRSHKWTRYFSPFFVGPIEMYDGYISHNLENCYQYSKVFSQHINHEQNPTQSYFDFAKKGWESKTPVKYPMGAWETPLFHFWDGKKLSHKEARKTIFLDNYVKAVKDTEKFKSLKKISEQYEEVYLIDFEGYNFRNLNMTYQDVLESNFTFGQGMVLSMMIDGFV